MNPIPHWANVIKKGNAEEIQKYPSEFFKIYITIDIPLSQVNPSKHPHTYRWIKSHYFKGDSGVVSIGPVEAAIDTDDEEVVKEVVKKTIFVDEDIYTPLSSYEGAYAQKLFFIYSLAKDRKAVEYLIKSELSPDLIISGSSWSMELVNEILGHDVSKNLPPYHEFLPMENEFVDVNLMKEALRFLVEEFGSEYNVEGSILVTLANYEEFELLQFLIEELGVDPDARNETGDTALMSIMGTFADDEDYRYIIDYLIEAGADIKGILVEAIRKGLATEAKHIFKYVKKDIIPDTDYEKIVFSMLSNDLGTLKRIISKIDMYNIMIEEDSEDEDSLTLTPLNWAISLRNRKAAKIILEYGKVVPELEAEAFMEAVEMEMLGAVKLMLRKGFNPNYQTDDGEYPLIEAVYTGNPKLVKLLLDAGANPNVIDFDEMTPLKAAEENDYLAIKNLLIKYGAREKEED